MGEHRRLEEERVAEYHLPKANATGERKGGRKGERRVERKVTGTKKTWMRKFGEGLPATWEGAWAFLYRPQRTAKEF